MLSRVNSAGSATRTLFAVVSVGLAAALVAPISAWAAPRGNPTPTPGPEVSVEGTPSAGSPAGEAGEVSGTSKPVGSADAISSIPADEPITPFGIDDVSIAIGYDGTAIFDANDQPGNDSGPNNGIVRTKDLVQYNFQYNSAAGLTNPYITSLLPQGMEWDANDATCVGSGTDPLVSGIYDSVTQSPGGDRRLLVCQLPSTATSVTDQILPIARVLVQPNGTALSVGFTAGDSSGVSVVSDEVAVTVSAAPFYDLRKMGRVTTGSATGRDGVTPGIRDQFAFGITLAHPNRSGPIDGVKGMSELTDVITFTDDLSALAPNAEFYDWNGANNACVSIGSVSFPVPASRIGIFGAATAVNSVVDSGTISCVGGAGSVEVTLTGADTSGASFPTTYSQGTPIAPNYLFVATGMINVWYPTSDVVDAGGSINITNILTDFDPDDVSGQSNYGAGTESLVNCFGRPSDNCQNSYPYTVNAGVSYSKYYRDYSDLGVPGEASGYRSADLRAGLGFRVNSYVGAELRVVPQENLALCDVFDRSSMRLVAGNNNSPVASLFTFTGLGVNDYVIEFGAPAVYPSTFAEARASKCGDGDATWSTDPTDAVLGGALTENGYRDSVDRVRVRLLVPAQAGYGYGLSTNLEVFAASSMDPAKNPTGAVLANFGQVRFGATPTWVANTFEPTTFTGNALGDRISLVPGEVRVAKSLVESAPGSGSQVLAGQVARFRLDPVVNYLGPVPGGPLQDVVVTDVLPTTAPRLVLDPVAVTRPVGVGVEFCQLCDGSDWSSVVPAPAYGVRWLFGDVQPGTALPSLEVTALVSLDAQNGLSYLNSAVISSPSDPSTVAQRTGSTSATVSAVSTVLTTKSARESTVPLNADMTWDLTVQNGTTIDVHSMDVIDLLPWNGDQRLPASAFSGGYSGVSVAGVPDGVEVYVTDADPVALDLLDGSRDGVLDPGRAGDGWYVPAGSGAWSCTLAQVDQPGCPTTAQVTGVRFASVGGAGFVLPATDAATWALTLSLAGNAQGNVYTNQFKGRADEAVLFLPVTSPPAPVQVVAPAVSIVKDVCTQVQCPVDDEAVWGQAHTVAAGDQGTFRLTVTNLGPEPGEVTVADVLPSGLTFVDGTAQASTGTVDDFPNTWAVGSLKPSESATLTFSAQTTVSGDYLNTVDARIVDRFAQEATSSDDAQLSALDADVTITKDLVDQVVDAAGNAALTYELTVTNTSAVDGMYTLRDQLAFGAGVTISGITVANTGPGDLVTNPNFDGVVDQVVITDQLIVAGVSHVYRVEVAASVPGGLPRDAVTCQIDRTAGGFANIGYLDLPTITRADVACGDGPEGRVEITKTAPATIDHTGLLTWTITVAQRGELAAGAFTVTDSLPAEVTYQSATGAPVVDAGKLTWSVDALKLGEVREYTVTAQLTDQATGAVRNCAAYATPQGWVQAPEGTDVACADTTISTSGPTATPGPTIPIVNLPITGGTIAGGTIALALTTIAIGLFLVRRRRNLTGRA